MKTLEQKLASLWLESVHCLAAVQSLANGRQPTKNLRDAIDLIGLVPGCMERFNQMVEVRKQRMANK